MFAAKAAPTEPSEREACSRAASRERHGAMFTWERVLGEYEGLLAGWLTGRVM